MFSGVGVLSVMLVIALANVFDPTVLDQGESNYGSSLVSQSAGSYVIVALIAFCLGVLLAVSVLFKSGRLTKRKHAKDEDRQF